MPEAEKYVAQDEHIANKAESEGLIRKGKGTGMYRKKSSYYTATQRKEEKKNKHSWTFWLPPGFRTLKLWKMCVGGLFYALALYISITLEVTGSDGSSMTGTALLANRIGCWLLFFVLVLFWFNYGGVHRILPFVRKLQIGWKILGYVREDIVTLVRKNIHDRMYLRNNRIAGWLTSILTYENGGDADETF